MTDYQTLERRFSEHLRLTRRPVAMAFRDGAPADVRRFEGVVPSGCSFWRLAADGQTFYTVPSDHYNCPIGAYTHNIPLPAERASELNEALETMAGIGYVRMSEVPGIPRLAETPGAIVYSALGDTPMPPDVVLFSVSAHTMMLLGEAAIRAGVAGAMQTLSRPTCMAVPASLASGVVASTGCVGNRVYTGIGDGEMYVAVPGRHLEALATELETVTGANAAMREYHQNRRQTLATV